MLEGTGGGPALNVVVMSEVQPSYAPRGRALVAAAVPGPSALEADMEAKVRRQLAGWFGSTTTDWTHLRTDVIPHGQPLQRPPLNPRQAVTLGQGLFVCGDHRDTASIQGAMFSGERTAEAVLRRLRGVAERPPVGVLVPAVPHRGGKMPTALTVVAGSAVRPSVSSPSSTRAISSVG